MPQPDAPVDRSGEFLEFVRTYSRHARQNDELPTALADWETQRSRIKEQLLNSWGRFPTEKCALEPRVLGELQRGDYRVEKLLFQTRPGIWMTANAYVPAGVGRRPAVLCVHGHWRGAKQDPVVQSRCIGLARLGFFVLVVDAFGAGERGIGKALGEYHGEMTATTLWPSGLALAGLQVYENMRAVDYLQSRPEVDPDRIGVTGASGGGNQSMYVGAIDERIGCVVPVCSVGTYDSYLGAACCMCELTPAVLSYTEEWGVLARVAPRGLMVINATQDAFQFSVGEAEKSLDSVAEVFRLYGVEEKLRHAVFESRHDYNQAMREAMYGWMTWHLKGVGDGAPIAEPEIETEEPETLRCYPGDSRPDEFVTLPQFAAAEARRLLKRRPVPDHPEHWQSEEMTMRAVLGDVLGGFPERTDVNLRVDRSDDGQSLLLQPEPGITISARLRPPIGTSRGLALLLDLERGQDVVDTDLSGALRAANWQVAGVDLRATGITAHPSDKIGAAPDHNTAEWAMLIGRPLLGQWVWDVTRLLDAYQEHSGRLPEQVAVLGIGPAGLVALCAASLSMRIDRVATIGSLASYVSEVPYVDQRVGTMVPGFLRDVGDVPHLAATVSPRRLVIAGGLSGAGELLAQTELADAFEFTRAAFRLEESAEELRILPGTEVESIVETIS